MLEEQGFTLWQTALKVSSINAVLPPDRHI